MIRIVVFCFLLSTYAILGALTGFGISPSITMDTVPPQIELLSPNGGEQWYIGDEYNVLWIGTDTNLPPNPISIWYSLNGGGSYTLLVANSANDGVHSWLLPYTQSSAAKVKINLVDSFGHVSDDFSNSPFSITYAPPQAPQNLTISLINNFDIMLNWDPVTQTIYNTAVTPDGYLILNSDTPGTEDDYTFLCYMANDTAFTHYNVARFSRRMFYRVVAYKDFSGRLTEYFETCLDDPTRIVTWREIHRELLRSNGGAE